MQVAMALADEATLLSLSEGVAASGVLALGPRTKPIDFGALRRIIEQGQDLSEVLQRQAQNAIRRAERAA